MDFRSIVVEDIGMTARFEPPVIQDNPSGWGPNTIPAQFRDMVSELSRSEGCEWQSFFCPFSVHYNSQFYPIVL